MKTKYYVLGILVAFIISNVLTTIWYMVMDEQNFVPFRRDEINYLGLLVNHLIYAGIMVYFYPFFFWQKPSSQNAFLFGGLIAALMFIPSALVVRSIWQVEIDAVFFSNTIAHLCIGGIMGIALHLITKKNLSNNNTESK